MAKKIARKTEIQKLAGEAKKTMAEEEVFRNMIYTLLMEETEEGQFEKEKIKKLITPKYHYLVDERLICKALTKALIKPSQTNKKRLALNQLTP